MKTNILKNLKQRTFLIIAILATFIGYSQSTITIGGTKIPTDPNGLIDIGGNKPPVGEFISNDLVANKLCDTGGGQTTTKPPILFFKNTVCEFVTPDDIGGNGGVIIGRPGIGGRNQDPTNPFSGLIVSQFEPTSLYDIGGKDKPEPTLFDVYQMSLSFALDTGGRNGVGTSSDTGQVNDANDTGGGRGANTNTGEFAYSDTGGRDSTGGLNPIIDIGGRGGTDTGAITDTGGRGTGTSTDTGQVNDIGGRGTGSDTGAIDCIICDIGGRNSTGDFAMFDDGFNTVASLNFIYSPEHGCTFDTGGKGGKGTSTGGDYGDSDANDYDIGGGKNSNGPIEFE